MKVFLTTLNAKYIHSSLALRYLRSHCGGDFPGMLLREFTINEPPPRIAGEIYRARVDVVAFSCYIWNIRQTLEVAAILKKVSPRTVVVLGGPEVSFDAAPLLAGNECIDFIVMGEGEETFRELLHALDQQVRTCPDDETPKPPDREAGLDGLSRIAGLCYRDADGSARENYPRPPSAPLDSIPSAYAGPAHADATHADQTAGDSFDAAADRGIDPALDLENRYVYYECSRGCPFACQFCLSSTTTGVRFFSLERVKSDLGRLIAAGARQIKFVDRTFNANRRFALEVWRFAVDRAKERMHRGLRAPRFYFEIGADLLDGDEELLEFLRGVPEGLFQFEIGVQTVDDEVNAIIGRRQQFTRLSRVVRRLAEPGNIRLHLDLIAALPTEGYAAFARSFNAVAELGAHELQLGFLKLLKGTELRRRAAECGYIWVDVPPYQVLASDAIGYDDLLRLEQVEDLVDRYWNAHLADEALAFLAGQAFDGDFGMWEAFAAYWAEKGLHRKEHTRAALYQELASFGGNVFTGGKDSERADVFIQLLKFGWLRHDQSRQLPAWCLPVGLTDDEKAKIWSGLSESDGELSRRYGVLEVFPFNPLHLKAHHGSSTLPTRQRTVLYFGYGPPGARRILAEVFEVKAGP